MGTIPPMTHVLSRAWHQPDHRRWVFDEMHVIMPKEDFELLAEYSCSVPSGVYEGKMWRRRVPYEDAPSHTWYLCWYDVSKKGPNFCATKQREILLV